MPFTPETPGKNMIFDKPGIPTPAWGDEEKEISHVVEGIAIFKGEYSYQDDEAGIVITGLKAKGYYIQHQRNGTFTADSSIRAFYNNTEILTNILGMDGTHPYTTAEMFIRNGMWIVQSTSPAESNSVDSPMQSAFSRALIKDEPYIDSLILGTSGATSGIYRVWIYE